MVDGAHILDVYAFRVYYLVDLGLSLSGLMHVFEVLLFRLVHRFVGGLQLSLDTLVFWVFQVPHLVILLVHLMPVYVSGVALYVL